MPFVIVQQDRQGPTHRSRPHTALFTFLKSGGGGLGSLDEFELGLAPVDALRLRHDGDVIRPSLAGPKSRVPYMSMSMGEEEGEGGRGNARMLSSCDGKYCRYFGPHRLTLTVCLPSRLGTYRVGLPLALLDGWWAWQRVQPPSRYTGLA